MRGIPRGRGDSWRKPGSPQGTSARRDVAAMENQGQLQVTNLQIPSSPIKGEAGGAKFPAATVPEEDNLRSSCSSALHVQGTQVETHWQWLGRRRILGDIHIEVQTILGRIDAKCKSTVLRASVAKLCARANSSPRIGWGRRLPSQVSNRGRRERNAQVRLGVLLVHSLYKTLGRVANWPHGCSDCGSCS